MADQHEFTDDELLKIYKNPASDLSKLTSSELQRLDALTTIPEQSWFGRAVQGAADRLGAITDNPGAAASNTATGVATSAALPIVGNAVRAAVQTMSPSLSKGGMVLLRLLGPKGRMAAHVIEAAGEASGSEAATGVSEVQAREIARNAARLQSRLSQVPLQGGEQATLGTAAANVPPASANQVAAQSLKAGVDTLAGDIGLIRSTIARRLATPAEAIKLAAAGNEEYAAALKKAYLESVDRLGLPKPFVPKSVVDLMKSESFQKLPKP